jgi:DNA-binding NarL/FixJ family response regulator
MYESSVNLTRAARILLVDPDEPGTHALAQHLRTLHPEWEVVYASSAAGAIDRLSHGPIDVMVTELDLPDMRGERLLRAVLEHHPSVVRVVLAGRPKAGLLGLAHLAQRVLRKPSDDATLIPALTAAVRLRREIQRASTAPRRAC